MSWAEGDIIQKLCTNYDDPRYQNENMATIAGPVQKELAKMMFDLT